MEILDKLSPKQIKHALEAAIKVMSLTLKCDSCPKSSECSQDTDGCYNNILSELLQKDLEPIVHLAVLKQIGGLT